MHDTVEHVFETQGSGIMELGLINGSSNFNTTFQEGKSHLVRLINTSMDTVYKVSLDGHKMKVIANDLVPVKPTTVDSVTLAQGQRYDVVIDADQAVQNYFLRAQTQGDCSPVGFPEVLGTVRYVKKDGTKPANFDLPATTAGLAPTTECKDGSFEPYLNLAVGPMSAELQDVQWVQNFPDEGPVFWSVKNVPYNSPWGYPSTSPSASRIHLPPRVITAANQPRFFQPCCKSPRRTPRTTRASRSSPCPATTPLGST